MSDVKHDSILDMIEMQIREARMTDDTDQPSVIVIDSLSEYALEPTRMIRLTDGTAILIDPTEHVVVKPPIDPSLLVIPGYTSTTPSNRAERREEKRRAKKPRGRPR